MQTLLHRAALIDSSHAVPSVVEILVGCFCMITQAPGLQHREMRGVMKFMR